MDIKVEVKKFEEIINKIEAKKVDIGIARDEMRELYDDLADILYSFDNGLELLEIGVNDIRNGIDSISEYI